MTHPVVVYIVMLACAASTGITAHQALETSGAWRSALLAVATLDLATTAFLARELHKEMKR